jgi:hypothetical protein
LGGVEVELRCRNNLDSIVAPFELGCGAHFIPLSVGKLARL